MNFDQLGLSASILSAVEAEGYTPAVADEDEVTRKVAIICSKGSLDMAYPGLIMANSQDRAALDLLGKLA